MKKQWTLTPKYSDKELSTLHKSLSKYTKNETNNPNSAYQILAKLLLQRGIQTVAQAVTFNNFDLDQLHDPFLMDQMQEAVDRILLAVEKNEKIMVYGDYDVDGTTSVALMVTYLKQLTSNLIYYIPDRYNEGYGVSIQGIDTASQENATLIIALDCGIKAVDKVAYANKLNIDFIICDHHTPGNILPKAVAILDPKKNHCSYPYKELSGCGIGFKLCQALAIAHPIKDNLLLELFDLTAISIACDIVPVTGENRVMASLGLKLINASPRPSISALLGDNDSPKKHTISDLVFQAGPKINAAGRISSGKTAVDLLLATDQNKITDFAERIGNFNTERKEEDKRITEEALEMIRNNPSLQHCNSTVLYDENWHKGVIGIVASRVTEHYYRPTIILTKSKGNIIGGSVRSVKGFDVYQALDACQEHMIQFGGHKYAAGLTLDKSQLSSFTKKFEEVVTAQMEQDSFIPTIGYDAEIELTDITSQLKQFIDKLEPFGPQNMTPTFVTRNVTATPNTRPVGADKAHLKLEVTNGNLGLKVPGIAFGLGHLSEEILLGSPFDIAYSIDINYWKNTATLQLMVKDIKLSHTTGQ